MANGPVAHVSSPPGSEIDVATERLNVLGGNGADQLSGVGNLAPLTALTMDGGAGDDRVLGGNGADTLRRRLRQRLRRRPAGQPTSR